MSIVLLLAVLAVLGAVAVVAAGRGTAMPDVDPDRSPLGVLPPDEVGPTEVERLRFSLAFRGYRMDEVDDVLDRLTAELTDRDARIAELETGAPAADSPASDRPASDKPASDKTVPVLPAEPVQPTTAIAPADQAQPADQAPPTKPVQANEPARPPEG